MNVKVLLTLSSVDKKTATHLILAITHKIHFILLCNIFLLYIEQTLLESHIARASKHEAQHTT